MVKMRRRVGIVVLAGIVVMLAGTGAWANVAADLQVGCRPQAMGGAFVAIADDVNAAWWNPAGIAQVQKGAFSFLHSNPFGISDFTLDYLTYIAPQSLNFINGGFALSYLKQAAKLKEGEDGQSNEMVAPEVYLLSIGGTAVENKLYYGLNLKGVALSAEVTGEGDVRRSGVAGDIGILYKISERFSMGAVRRNMAASLGEEGFPSSLRVGFAGKLLDDKLILAADFNSKEDIEGEEGTSWQSHFGVEWTVVPSFALRLGSDKGDFTAGFGFKFGLPGKIAPEGILDYSYTSNEELGSTSRFSFTILFK